MVFLEHKNYRPTIKDKFPKVDPTNLKAFVL